MNRTIMISDIHGCIDPFNQLLHDIDYNPQNDQLILLGDYVDRGPNSKEVVNKVVKLVHEHHAIALRGNHDQRLVDFINEGSSLIKAKFIEHGGIQTLQSYYHIDDELSDEMLDLARETIKMDYGHHIDFLSKLPFYHEDEAHIYVHAGLNPDYLEWRKQPDHDFMYIKDKFIDHTFTNLHQKVVFGHTRTIDIHGTSDVWFGEDKIGIDGGCAYGMQLNALIHENGSYITADSKFNLSEVQR
ncbi:metallophosphoesterase [Paenibacillus sp. 1781tsa1]|uniref:metallophosphoesterase n=1 Tax=Paenibacillus sp. 1781tsa1 TaxID=2953810 RepID=UPI00209CD17C|nr:metallophosphoesterase [Paenibacillus sp. 1781tsa1]MCP1183728.1 metallophosphoesterase [Paenibacillus sp. 1781tsa1]